MKKVGCLYLYSHFENIIYIKLLILQVDILNSCKNTKKSTKIEVRMNILKRLKSFPR